MTQRSLDAETQFFLREIEQTIDRHGLLKHPFYQLWNEGRLSRDILAEYAKQYYAHVRAFPTYLSAVHSRCPDLPVRQLLLENLMDEELGEENHPELWLRFGESLGVSREEMQSAEPLPSTVESVNALRRLTERDDYRDGVAALYAYESQVPDVARSKREGLAAFYGIDDDGAVKFFTVHEEADLEHRADEQRILVEQCDTPAARAQAVAAADGAARALWRFLDGVYDAYVDDGRPQTRVYQVQN